MRACFPEMPEENLQTASIPSVRYRKGYLICSIGARSFDNRPLTTANMLA